MCPVDSKLSGEGFTAFPCYVPSAQKHGGPWQLLRKYFFGKRLSSVMLNFPVDRYPSFHQFRTLLYNILIDAHPAFAWILPWWGRTHHLQRLCLLVTDQFYYWKALPSIGIKISLELSYVQPSLLPLLSRKRPNIFSMRQNMEYWRRAPSPPLSSTAAGLTLKGPASLAPTLSSLSPHGQIFGCPHTWVRICSSIQTSCKMV